MDNQAFSNLVLAQTADVYRLAVYLSCRGEADDLVQETYVRAFRSWTTYRANDFGIRPWLFKILHNVIYDRSSEKRRRHEAMDHLREAHQHSYLQQSINRSQRDMELDWEQIDDRLRVAIETLPLRYRSVFLLSAIEGLRYREIAKITDVPIGTVMSRLCRARAALLSQLADFAEEKGLNRRSSSRSSSLDQDTPEESESPSPGEYKQDKRRS